MAAPYPSGFPIPPNSGPAPASLGDAASVTWLRQVVAIARTMLQGKLNAVLGITLVNGATSTVIQDPRITVTSALFLQPLTAHAWALNVGATPILPTLQNTGIVTFTHASTANTDQNFNLLIIG